MLKGTVRKFRAHNLTDWAAALTYYGVLAIFPALIVLVSLLGPDRRVGHPAADRQPRQRSRPGPAQDIFTSAIKNIQGSQGAAGVCFVFGLLARAVVGVRLHRRLHARVERDLRHRGGAADLEDAAGAARPHGRC